MATKVYRPAGESRMRLVQMLCDTGDSEPDSSIVSLLGEIALDLGDIRDMLAVLLYGEEDADDDHPPAGTQLDHVPTNADGSPNWNTTAMIRKGDDSVGGR